MDPHDGRSPARWPARTQARGLEISAPQQDSCKLRSSVWAAPGLLLLPPGMAPLRQVILAIGLAREFIQVFPFFLFNPVLSNHMPPSPYL